MKRLSFLLVLVIFLAACAPAGGETPIPPTATTQLTNTPLPPTPTETPIPLPPTETPVSPTPEPSHTPAPTALSAPLDAAPQMVRFQSSDGQELQGTYYPAAQLSAPLIVLMHWAPGDQNEWASIAPWLQNRGLAKKSGAPGWKDPAWFPPLPEGDSYAVFTFTFRGCRGGCASFTRAEWLKDARSAMEYAVTLPGVDAQRVVAFGSSIGADGAINGCLWLNKQGSGRCLGAMSFSPGDYLNVSYAGAAQSLNALGFPAWCFYAEQDSESALVCSAVKVGELARVFPYPGSDHGMMLLREPIDPNPLALMLEFLDTYVK